MKKGGAWGLSDDAEPEGVAGEWGGWLCGGGEPKEGTMAPTAVRLRGSRSHSFSYALD
jgi:hypothetical protein